MEDQTNGLLLSRIDERTLMLVSEVHSIKQRLDTRFVSQDEFRPVKNLTYGLVGALCMGVLAAILKIIFHP